MFHRLCKRTLIKAGYLQWHKSNYTWLRFPFSLQAVYVTATLPYIVLAIFFGRAVTLKGSLDGIIHMFKPQVIKYIS